jgi:hypothetical protein
MEISDFCGFETRFLIDDDETDTAGDTNTQTLLHCCIAQALFN